MIIEGIVTTEDEMGKANVAPMGPIVASDFPAMPGEMILRPFQTSTTFTNLMRSSVGVFHLTDNARLIASSVIGKPSSALGRAKAVDCCRLAGFCSAVEFEVTRRDTRMPRSEMVAKIVHVEHGEAWRGFNRASHALLELAILATRTFLLEESFILGEFDRLLSPIEKTGEQSDREMYNELREFVIARKLEEKNREPG